MTNPTTAARLSATVTQLHRLLKRGVVKTTPAQEILLLQLTQSGPQTVSQLASHQGVRNATISRMLGTLERKALVRRARDKRDRRVVYVIATREALAQSRQDHENSAVAFLLGDLTEEQIQTVTYALDILDGAMAKDD
ncbi:MAG: MarR family winged helix-turn-helix transcriptional regulator [Lysobacterales bacterium]